MKKKKYGIILLLLSICLFGCESKSDIKRTSKQDVISEGSISPENSDTFEMNHEVRKGFINPKEEIDQDKFIPIKSVTDLRNMRNNNKKSYILINDLDLSDTSWDTFDFYGYLEGNYHTISGLKNTLFGQLNGEVKNLGLESVEVESSALAGQMIGGSVSNCYVTGTVQGFAGLIKEVHSGYHGSSSSVRIDYCYNAAEVNGTEKRYEKDGMAGIIGQIDMCVGPFDIAIDNCENYGIITGTENTGGIVGKIFRGSSSGYYDNSKVNCNITRCFNYNDVISSKIAGGIVGDIYAVNATNDYENIYRIQQCANYGKVSLQDSKENSDCDYGGICGDVSLVDGEKICNAIQLMVENCLNTGDSGGMCGNIELDYGTCEIRYCLNIGGGGIAFDNGGGSKRVFIMEECYSKGDMSIAKMKDMKKNLPKFSYPGIWGITELYCGFPHPYGVDEGEAVNEYYENKHQEAAKELKENMKEDEIILNQHYVDMLESMNYTGCWLEDEKFENPYEYLQCYSDNLQASFAILDVNNDGKKELAVKAFENYRIYTYDSGANKAEKMYEAETEQQWKSDYGNKLDIDWEVMQPENYTLYSDAYEAMYEEKLTQDLKRDMGTLFVQNKGNFEKTQEGISSLCAIQFKENEETYSTEGIYNGEKVLEIYEEDGSSLQYQKAVEDVTLFGIKPGISEDEAKNIIGQYGFYMGRYNYKMGKYFLNFEVENGIITSISTYEGSEYAG